MMNDARRILILFAHPTIRRSRVNRRLVAAARSVGGVTVHDLYEAYPDLDINVRREQELLAACEVVVFQHPFYWYSTPAILKEWQDLVLEHGWAFGHGGNALRDKQSLSAVSTGAGEDAYCRQGANHFTLGELLSPIAQMASLCGMVYLPPFVVHGTHRLLEAEMDRHARDYRRVLEGLRDGRLDIEAARRMPRINSDLDRLLGG